MLGELDYISRYRKVARRYRADGYALAWREVGINPDAAATWANADFRPSEAQRMIANGIVRPALPADHGPPLERAAHGRKRGDWLRRMTFAVMVRANLPHIRYAPEDFDSWRGRAIPIYHRSGRRELKMAEAKVIDAEVVGSRAVVLTFEAAGGEASSLRTVLEGGYAVGWLMPFTDAIAFTPVED